ncbi:CLUMA_CG016900, isoform A [Clunio marinus]|uniref:CLUMA_CG016900, isoform A n=1 Tax=Clunio marinus TaxID=568069 RepID=A0A1J1ITK3_9DIPT|nr:CLUMA_CG016900, isoform A [Clunio marinus]
MSCKIIYLKKADNVLLNPFDEILISREQKMKDSNARYGKIRFMFYKNVELGKYDLRWLAAFMPKTLSRIRNIA